VPSLGKRELKFRLPSDLSASLHPGIAGKLLLSSAKILEIIYDTVQVASNPRGEAVLLVLQVRISFTWFTLPDV